MLENVVAAQLRTYLQDNNILEKSSFWSAPTVLRWPWVTNNLQMVADAGCLSLLVLLDLSAAFYIVDHTLHLDHLHSIVGICELTQSWFQSYLAGWTECVYLGGAKSSTQPVTCGLHLGSVLSPLYMLTLGCVISRHSVSFTLLCR